MMGHQIETCWGNRHLSMFSIWFQACKSAIFIHRLQSPQSEHTSVLSSNLSIKHAQRPLTSIQIALVFVMLRRQATTLNVNPACAGQK